VVESAGRISDVAGTSNHSLNGLVSRLLGPGAAPVYLAGAAVLVVLTLALARRAGEREAVVLVGLCSAAVAPFSWSHHWVWVVPLTVLLVRRSAWWLLGAVLVTTVAVITAPPGPAVGPIPSTGLISLQPDVYVVLFLVVLACSATRRARPRRVTSGASS
jgi:alpha-1,2-mannosyltransferase